MKGETADFGSQNDARPSCLAYRPIRILGRLSTILGAWKALKKMLFLGVNVFSTTVLVKDTILTSPTGDGTAILCG